jgi:hypothetical protein
MMFGQRLIIRPGAIGDCILSLPAMGGCAGLFGNGRTSRSFARDICGSDAFHCPSDWNAPWVRPGLVEELRQFDSFFWYGANQRVRVGFDVSLPLNFYHAAAKDSRTRRIFSDSGGRGPRRSASSFRAKPTRFRGAASLRRESAKRWPLGDSVSWRAFWAQHAGQWCAGPEESSGAVRIDNLYDWPGISLRRAYSWGTIRASLTWPPRSRLRLSLCSAQPILACGRREERAWRW